MRGETAGRRSGLLLSATLLAMASGAFAAQKEVKCAGAAPLIELIGADESSPLVAAVAKSDLKAIDRLLPRSSSTPEDVLILASATGKLAVVARFLKKGVSVDAQNAAGRTSLEGSVVYGCAGITKVLLEAGANPNLRNHDRVTPLFYSVTQDDIAATKMLLEHGADASASFDGVSVRTLAGHTRDAELVQLIEQAIRASNASAPSGTAPN